MPIDKQTLEQMARNLLKCSDFTIKQVILHMEEEDKKALQEILETLKDENR
jgi:hypothetical protein